MGGSLFCFVESKSFEFSVEEGGSFFLLRIYERGRNSLRSVFMGKECAKRMLSIMEKFILSELPEHFARTIREGETMFIIQLGSNAHGYYLMISELLHGRRKGFLVIPEGRMGHGWRGFMWHPKKVFGDSGIKQVSVIPTGGWIESQHFLRCSGGARPSEWAQRSQVGSRGDPGL